MAIDEVEFNRQLEENRRAYESLRDEIRTKYPDQYVAIAFGRIVGVDPDFHRAAAAADSLVPKPLHSAVFRGDDDNAEASFVVVDSLGFEMID